MQIPLFTYRTRNRADQNYYTWWITKNRLRYMYISKWAKNSPVGRKPQQTNKHYTIKKKPPALLFVMTKIYRTVFLYFKMLLNVIHISSPLKAILKQCLQIYFMREVQISNVHIRRRSSKRTECLWTHLFLWFS